MNTEQIIKALECCYDNNLSCSDCPFQQTDKFLECSNLTNNALALIKELQAHNENLERTIKYLRERLAEEAEIKEDMAVVRCKDCKHRYEPCRCALWYGTVEGKEYFIARGDDFYCSYGERRE